MSGSEREHLSNFLQFGEILRHSTACISALWLHIGRLGETPQEPKYEETQATSKKLQHRTELRNYNVQTIPNEPKFQDIVYFRKGNL